MRNELFIAVLSGLGGMLGWGMADFFAKKTIDALGDVTTLFWSQLLGIGPLIVAAAFFPSANRLTHLDLIFLPLLGVSSGLSYIPTYIAFGKGKVSILSPIFASYAVVLTILSVVFFGEALPLKRLVAFAIVFAGVLLVTGDPRAFSPSDSIANQERPAVKGLKEILFAVCLYSLWLLALDRLVNGRYWVPLLLVIRIFSAAALFVYVIFSGRKFAVAPPSLWLFLILIGCFDVAAFACVAYGFSSTRLPSVVAMLSGAFSLPTIVLARIFLKERSTLLQCIGSIVVVVGIMLLAVL